MTEAEWRRSNNVFDLLCCEALRPGARGLRLLLCGWLREEKVWSLLTARGREAVEVSEAFADGAADTGELRAAYRRSFGGWSGASGLDGVTAAMLANDACWQNYSLQRSGLTTLRGRLGRRKLPFSVGLVREVFGNPFRPVPLDRSALTPTVASLAEAAYEHRDLPSGHLDPARLAVLSDALEESGVTGEILSHLRSPGPHVRGCWAVELCRSSADQG
jgi:hypothetical protein